MAEPEAAGGPVKPAGGPDRGILKRGVLTVWTLLLWIFRSPTMLSVLVGVGIGYYIGSNVGQARVLPRAIKAEQALADLQTKMAQAIERAAVAQVTIRDQVRRDYEDQRIRLDALGRRLGDVSNGVSLCGATVSVPLPDAAAGAGDAGAGGQSVPADQVLAKLAASIAATCDRNGAQLNALIDWLKQTGNQPPAN